MVEREARMIEMILFLHPRIKVWVVWVDTFRQLLVAFTGTLMEPPPHTPAREINVNVTALQSTKNGDAICVTDPITNITITWNEDLYEDGYDSDGDIGTSFDAVLYEEDIEDYTEKAINNKIGRDYVTIFPAVSSIETTEIKN